MNRNQSKIVFVGNIPYGLSEEQISDIFSSAGRVVNFRLVYDRENGKPKGFGFAEYPDPDSAASAVRNLNDYEVMGRKLRVDFSNEGDDIMLAGPFGPPGGGSTATTTTTSSAPSILPPLPPGKDIPPGASAADEISRVLRTLPPTQLLDVLTQMKALAANEPARATELLAQAPQLAYAVFQALLLMDLVSPEAIQAVVDPSGAAHLGAGPPPGAQPPAQALPVHHGYEAPPQQPVQQMAPAAPPAAPAMAAPAAAAPMSQEDLIKQVVELPQSVVDMLPEPDRTTVIALRMQYGGGAR